jgi:MscS family membrane protein
MRFLSLISLSHFSLLDQAPAVLNAWQGTIWDDPQRFVGWLHAYVPEVNEGLFRWMVALLIIGLTILLRRLVTRVFLRQLQKLFGNGKGMDDRVFTALITPVAALLMVGGIFAALAVLNLDSEGQWLVERGSRAAFTAVLLWCFLEGGGAVLDHIEKVSRSKGLGVGAFMPLLKKTLGVIFGILSVLIIAASLGAHVETFLAGLGIGGLAVALAAQDTLSNMFGSVVVMVDHPFHVGDSVKIAGNEGTVEDIGLRSTRLRTAARTLIVIPNKTVASEAITNYSRMPQRRVDQSIGLTYDTKPAQMEAILADLRAVLMGDPGVHKTLVAVNFVEFGESSLDLQIVYFTVDPDWLAHLAVRERVNLKIMRSVAAHGLEFAFPTQTVIHENADPGAAAPAMGPGVAGNVGTESKA